MFAWSNVFLSVDDILVSFNVRKVSNYYSGLFISPLANNAYTLSLEMIDSSFLYDIPKYIGFIFSQIHAHTSPCVCQKTHMETCWFILQWKRDTSQLHEYCGGNKLNLRVKLIFMYYIVMCWVNVSDLWLITIHFIISSLIKFFFLFPKQLILVPTRNPEWYVGLIDWFFLEHQQSQYDSEVSLNITTVCFIYLCIVSLLCPLWKLKLLWVFEFHLLMLQNLTR